MKVTKFIIIGCLTFGLFACGGGGGGGGSAGTTNNANQTTLVAQFIDSAVGGLSYSCASTNGTTQAQSGVTNSNGEFRYVAGQTCTFSVGNVTIGSVENIPSDGIVTPQDVAGIARTGTSSPAVTAIAQFLQSLNDGSNASGLTIPSSVRTALSSNLISPVVLVSASTGVMSQADLTSLVQAVNRPLVSANVATAELQQQITSGKVNVSTGGISSSSPAILTSIAITATSPSVAAGLTNQMSATGYYSDGTSQDISTRVTWMSVQSSLATIDSSGLVTAVSQGSATIKASLSGKSAVTQLEQTSAVLQSLTISPSNPSVPAGRSVNLVVTGHYSDGTNNNNLTGINWTSTSPNVASVSSQGVVTAGMNTGSTAVSVNNGTINSTPITLTVTSPTISSIVISAASNAVQVGGAIILNALANFSNSTQQTITSLVNWIVSATSGSSGSATIANLTGILTGITAGDVVVQSNYIGVTSNQLIIKVNGKFETTPLTLPSLSDYLNICQQGNPFVSTVTPIDFNNDGKMDLAIHLWCNATSGSNLSTEAPNALVTFIQQSNGTFSNSNQILFGTDIVQLGGASRKVKVGDLNGDGYQDLSYAINEEDGRAEFNGNQAARPTIVLSNGNGSYQVTKVGQADWLHNVALADNDVGGQDVVFQGFYGVGAQAFRYLNGAFTAIQNYPTYLSAFTFNFAKKPDVSHGSQKIITTSSSCCSALDLLVNTQGSWVVTDTYTIPSSQSIPFVTWQGTSTTANLMTISGYQLVGTAFDESCIMSTNNVNKVAIVNLNGSILPNGYQGGVVYQNGLQNFNGLFAFDITGNSISLLSNVFTNIRTDYTGNFYDCKDINSDGYQDVVVYAQSGRGVPHIYLNNKNGGLVWYDTSLLPSAPNSFGNSSSVMADFNNDGVMDVLYFPMSLQTGSAQFKLYKGLANL